MNYIGTWKFHSIGVMRDEGIVYINGEEYLKEPMPYIDETDEEAVEDELRERKIAIAMQVKVCEDGKLYLCVSSPTIKDKPVSKCYLNLKLQMKVFQKLF